MRRRPTYFIEYCLRDGTVVGALQTRKPTPRQLQYGGRLEADGIWERYVVADYDYIEASDSQKVVRQAAITGMLNMRQLLRDLVLPRLDAIERRLDAIEASNRQPAG